MYSEISVLDFIWWLMARRWWGFVFLRRAETDKINFHVVFLCRWIEFIFFSNLPSHGAPTLSKLLGFHRHLSSISPPYGGFVLCSPSSRSLEWENSISLVTDPAFAFLFGFLLPFLCFVWLFGFWALRIFPLLSSEIYV